MKEYWDKFTAWCKNDYNRWVLIAAVVLVLVFISCWDFIVDNFGFPLLICGIIVAITLIWGRDELTASSTSTKGGIHCPHCGSKNISVQVFQENTNSKTVTKKTGTYKEKGHGLIYKYCFGWAIDLLSWIFFTFPRLLFHIGRKRTYVENSKSVSKTKNNYEYKRICVCQKCGYQWER